MSPLTQDEIKKAKEILHKKCGHPGCFNYREHGYIYCVNHLHGFPERISKKDIDLLGHYMNEHKKEAKTT